MLALGSNHAAEHAEERADYCAAELALAASQKGFWNFLVNSVSPLRDRIDKWLGFTPDASGAVNRLAQLIDKVIGTARAVMTGPKHVIGQWGVPLPFRDASQNLINGVGISAVVLHTGDVLFWSTRARDTTPEEEGGSKPINTTLSFLWTPPNINDPDGTGASRKLNFPCLTVDSRGVCVEGDNIWCAGQTLLADGRVAIVGGNLAYPIRDDNYKGLNRVYTYNPFNFNFLRQSDMRNGRWYPTATKINDGRVVIVGGLDQDGDSSQNRDVDVFTPAKNFSVKGTVELVIDGAAAGARDLEGTYPHQFLMPGGKVTVFAATQNNTSTKTHQCHTYSASRRHSLAMGGFGHTAQHQRRALRLWQRRITLASA